MDHLTEQEIRGIKQDLKHAAAKEIAEKTVFEKRLLEGLGDEIVDTLEHPEKNDENQKFAKEYTKKKKRAIWKENIKKILGI